MRKLAIFLLLFLAVACVRSPQVTTVNYVRSSDIAVPDMNALVAAAQAGDPNAEYQLGAFYYRGFGVPKSHKEAMRLWKLAAEKGHPEAQYSLGMANFEAKGVVNDFVEGCRWLGMAAAQGHPDAQAAYHARCDR